MKALEKHIRQPLRSLLKLQEDTTGVSGSAYMKVVGDFLESDTLQLMIDSLQTAFYILENEKVTTVAPEITSNNSKKE